MFTLPRIFITIALLIVSMALYLLFSGPTLNSKVEEIEEITKENAEESESETDEKNKKKDKKKFREDENEYAIEPPFFSLPTIRIAILKDDGKIAGYLHLKLEMEAASIDDFNTARILLPRLVNGIFEDLYSALSNLWINKENPKVDVIKERVLKVAEKILGKDKIKSVFVRQIFLDRLEL